MELSLGRRADYAIRAVLDLARPRDGELRKAREIGDEMGVPATYLPQILGRLVRAGIAASVAGPRGGYRLARPADAITLLDVIEATEGGPLASECVLRGGPCRWDDMCAVHVPWSRAQQALLDQLASTTVADVAAIDAEMVAGRFVPPADVARPTHRRGGGAGQGTGDRRAVK